MNVLECPYTKELLDAYINAYPDVNVDNAKEREKLVTTIRPLICGNPANRNVCCNVCNDGFYNFPTCTGKQRMTN